jgi:dihydrofolate synthase/folylpolyglutamate synthase
LVRQVHAVGFAHPLAMTAEALATTATAQDLPAAPCPSLQAAIASVPEGAAILIAGSLYLAGEVLALNNERPD